METTHFINQDFVLFSSQQWDADIASNLKDIAWELSKQNRVLFVNRATDRFSQIKKNFKPKTEDSPESPELTEAGVGLWIFNPPSVLESINWIPFGTAHDVLNRINNGRLATQINRIIARLAFKDVVVLNDNDFIRGRYLKRLIPNSFNIFYQRDDMLSIGYFQRHGARLQAGAMADADMIATNSDYLANMARRFNPCSFDIGQGCDLTLFKPGAGPPPPDIVKIARPVIGYTGYISAWRIDLDLLKCLAENLPEYNIVLIGPIDVLFKVDQIKSYSNAHFLESKPVTALPPYLEYFDICINPQVLNNTTVGNYPRKVDEYLAMGKVVVATSTEAMKLFEPFTVLCNNKFDFLYQIRDILARPALYMSEQAREKRIAFARTHSWQHSMSRLKDAYLETKTKKMKQDPTVSGKKFSDDRLQALSILFVAVYLLLVYVKFLFF